MRGGVVAQAEEALAAESAQSTAVIADLKKQLIESYSAREELEEEAAEYQQQIKHLQLLVSDLRNRHDALEMQVMAARPMSRDGALKFASMRPASARVYVCAVDGSCFPVCLFRFPHARARWS